MNKKKIITVIVAALIVAGTVTAIVFAASKNTSKFGGEYPFRVKTEGKTARIKMSSGDWVVCSDSAILAVTPDSTRQFNVSGIIPGTEKLDFIYGISADEGYIVSVTFAVEEDLTLTVARGYYTEVRNETELDGTGVFAFTDNGRLTLTFRGLAGGTWEKDIPAEITSTDAMSDGTDTRFVLTASKEGEYTAKFTDRTEGAAFEIKLRADGMFNLYADGASKSDADTEEEGTTAAFDYAALSSAEKRFGRITLPDGLPFVAAEFDKDYAYLEFSRSGEKDYLEIAAQGYKDFSFSEEENAEVRNVGGVSVSFYTDGNGNTAAEWTDGDMYRLYLHSADADATEKFLSGIVEE